VPDKPKPIRAKQRKTLEQLLAECEALRKKSAALDIQLLSLMEDIRVNAGGKPKK
jgi:hypothetical protein